MPPKKGEPKKGDKSKTMPGEEDFTTKASSEEFDRGGKREKKAEGASKDRKPFSKKKGMRKMSEKEKELVKKMIDKKSLGKSEQAKLRMAVMRSSESLTEMKHLTKLMKK